jgi:hypothetical protein
MIRVANEDGLLLESATVSPTGAHVGFWHYPESVSRRIKSVRSLRYKRTAGGRPGASVERPDLTPKPTNESMSLCANFLLSEAAQRY